MLEFSHEANTCMIMVFEALREVTSIVTDTPLKSIEENPVSFVSVLSQHMEELSRLFGLFVPAVAASARASGVFPTVIPIRPQPSNQLTSAFSSARGSNRALKDNGKTIETAVFTNRYIGSPSCTLWFSEDPQFEGSTESNPCQNQRNISKEHLSGVETYSTLAFLPPVKPVTDKPKIKAVVDGSQLSALAHERLQEKLLLNPFPRITNRSHILDATSVAEFEAVNGSDGQQSCNEPQNSIVTNNTKIAAAMAPIISKPYHKNAETLALSQVTSNSPRYSPTGDALEGAITTAAYVLLEILARETYAREATWYRYSSGSDEAQALCLFGEKPKAPHSARVSIHKGVVGACLKTGMLINVQPREPKLNNGYALAVPIFPPHTRIYPIGCVLIEHKVTETPFTAEDEMAVLSWVMYAAHIMTAYPIDLGKVYFDPFVGLRSKANPYNVWRRLPLHHSAHGHRDVDFEAEFFHEVFLDSSTSVLAQQTRRATQEGKSIYDGTQQYTAQLGKAIKARPTAPRVFRCTSHNQFTVLRGGNLGGVGVALTMQHPVDVAEYVASLEERWRVTTSDLNGVASAHVAQIAAFRGRQRRLKELETELRQSSMREQHAKAKYNSLKEELTAVVGRPLNEETGTFIVSSSTSSDNDDRSQQSLEAYNDDKVTTLAVGDDLRQLLRDVPLPPSLRNYHKKSPEKSDGL